MNKEQNQNDATIAKYVVKGMMNENESTFIDRLSILFAHNNKALRLLVNGVPVNVKIVDHQAIIDYRSDIIAVKKAEITSDFDIKITVVKEQKRYFKDEISANKADRWDGYSKQTEEYSFEKIFEVEDTIYPTDELKDAVEIEYL